MKAAIISFTARGAKTALRIREALENKINPQNESVLADGRALPVSLREWTKEIFAEYDALVFVGATGIAVRSIAPFLKSKTSDPAVLCADELGKFVIPLVSGHIGGANALAAELADKLGAVAVITTATDLNGRFAVDVFATKNDLRISDMKLAKQISADILDGKKIGFVSDFPTVGKMPEELELWNAGDKDFQEENSMEENIREGDTREKNIREGDAGEKLARMKDAPACGVCITLDETKKPFRQTLTLIPRIVSVGVGCRKGADPALIEEKVLEALRACGFSIRSVERLASIDLKAREPGLIAFARKYGLEFVTYSAQELREASGEFEESAFVEAVTGVSNVCERSAVLASGGKTMPVRCGRLIRKKTAGDGVTVALAVRDWSVEFG